MVRGRVGVPGAVPGGRLHYLDGKIGVKDFDV